MKKSLQNSYRKSIKWSLAGSLASAIFQLAQMVVFARLSGPEAAGVYALATAIIGFLAPVAEAGLMQALVQADTVHRWQMIRMSTINLVLGMLIFIGLWLAGPYLLHWYNSEELPSLLLLMGSSLLFTPLGALRSALLTRTMAFDKLAKIEVVAWFFSFLITTLLAWKGWGVTAMGIGFLVRNMVATVGSVIALPYLPLPSIGGEKTDKFLRFGMFDLSNRWAEFLANYLDKFIVGKWLGMEALGFYNLAFTFLMLPTARIGYVVTRVSFPLYARIREQKKELQAFFEQISQEIVLVLFPVYAMMALFAQEIIQIFFGPDWLPAAPLLMMFALAGLVRTLCTPFPQLMRGLGKPQLWLVWLLVFTCALNIGLIAVLSLFPQVEAAGWSRVLVKITVEIPLLFLLARMVGVPFQPVLRYAIDWAGRLLPVVVATWLAGQIPGSFWSVLTLKSAVFSIGIIWLAQTGPLQIWLKSWLKT